LKFNPKSSRFIFLKKTGTNQVLQPGYRVRIKQIYMAVRFLRGTLRCNYKNGNQLHYNFDKTGKRGNIENSFFSFFKKK